MVRQDGYNIIIEMEAPPREYNYWQYDFNDPTKSIQENIQRFEKARYEDLLYRNNIDRLKREIRDFAEHIFAKEIGKNITEEAVKCVDDVVRKTLK